MVTYQSPLVTNVVAHVWRGPGEKGGGSGGGENIEDKN